MDYNYNIRTVAPAFAVCLEPLYHCRNIVSLRLFYWYYFGRCSLNWQNCFGFLIVVVGPHVILMDCMIFCHTFQVLLFQFHFNKKIVEVVINDFKVYVIILKWLRGPKCRQRKTVRQKDIKAKERIIYKSLFIYLKRNRSWRRSLFLLDFFMNLL